MAFLARREFLKTAGTLAATVTPIPASWSRAAEPRDPEEAVAALVRSLSPSQKKVVMFDWDHHDPKLGLLRRRVAANWRITPPAVKSDFFTAAQQGIVREIFEGLVQPDWRARFDRELKDDTGGFGVEQSIAIFATPDQTKSQFILTSRHMTLRCDGGSDKDLAFGGPIFYGHAAGNFHEAPTHPGNVFWYQGLEANRVFGMLDASGQKQALVKQAPRENAVAFQGPRGRFPGVPVRELSGQARAQVEKTLAAVLEPFRQADRQRVQECLKSQGGLEACSLAFYEQGDLGNDRIWDIWRLEGPAFVWHFRGAPHVHVWLHVARDPAIPLNA